MDRHNLKLLPPISNLGGLKGIKAAVLRLWDQMNQIISIIKADSIVTGPGLGEAMTDRGRMLYVSEPQGSGSEEGLGGGAAETPFSVIDGDDPSNFYINYGTAFGIIPDGVGPGSQLPKTDADYTLVVYFRSLLPESASVVSSTESLPTLGPDQERVTIPLVTVRSGVPYALVSGSIAGCWNGNWRFWAV